MFGGLVGFSVVGLRSRLEAYALFDSVNGPSPLRAYREAVEMNRRLARVVAGIEVHDQDLLRQLKRAAGNVALQIAESRGTQTGQGELKLQGALGAVREVEACLDIALAWGYLQKGDRHARKSVDRLAATLTRLVRPARRSLIVRR